MALAAAGTLAMTTMTPQPAEARNGAGLAFGILGGLAAGAVIAGAASNNGYAYGPGYYAYGSRCYWQRQQVWDGYGYRWQRVQVCG